MIKKLLIFIFAISLIADNFVSLNDTSDKTSVDSNIPEFAVPTPLPPIEPIVNSKKIKKSAPDQDGLFSVQKVEFWVQMGAFASLDSARALETKLKARGLNAKLFSADMHKVAVGPYSSREQATRSLGTLRDIEKEAFLTTPDHLR